MTKPKTPRRPGRRRSTANDNPRRRAMAASGHQRKRAAPPEPKEAGDDTVSEAGLSVPIEYLLPQLDDE